ncbi:hypothetical protein [Lactobacillus sp. ESL0703]|nr:hypothetical protein [Lactobacillus sp. ESL0703]MDF7668531.1 hypothetical protein [Lactobacillus sp. ESL0703]
MSESKITTKIEINVDQAIGALDKLLDKLKEANNEYEKLRNNSRS